MSFEAHSHLFDSESIKTMSTAPRSSFASPRKPSNYSPYGYRNAEEQRVGQLGFNGELLSSSMECYALGNGHRIYSPRLMRFISADALSPFNRGGINCYAYCLNDPVNAQDPTGKSPFKTAAIKVLAVNKFKKTLSSRTKISTQWQTLGNIYADDLTSELIHANRLIGEKTARITLIEGPQSLSRLSNPELQHKFVLTRDRKFIIGSFSGDDPSHASIAKIGQWKTGASSEVVSAGYITKDGDRFSLDNHSGHYLPSVQQLTPAKDHLEQLGIAVKELRDIKPFSGYVDGL